MTVVFNWGMRFQNFIAYIKHEQAARTLEIEALHTRIDL
jgi:hypothetical protein